MTNNLRQISKDLRAFAKRTKDFKYTDSALIIFLMTGMISITTNLFPAATTAKSIETQRQEISSSIKGLHQKVKETRRENEKLLKDTNLELVKLMEQGDQVVKAPWSSWQFGMNYFNNNWNGTYKGRGDKKTKYPYEGVFQRSSNSFDRYTSPLSKHYGELPLGANRRSASSNERKNLPLSSYGLASNDPAQEPIVEMNVEASIRPKTVNIDIPDLGIRAPRLQALTVNGTEPPAITVPEPDTPTKEVHIVEPNAEPFTGFFFNGTTSEIGTTTTTDPITGGTYYGGIQENSWHDTDGDGINDAVIGAAETGQARTATKTSNRPTNIFYRIGTSLSNVTFYVRGHMNSDTYTDQGSGASGGVDPTNGISGGPVVPTDGTIAIHTLKDMNVSNVTANLYGRAGFLTSET